ncbi:hypothetical protein BGP77_08695 [Saccharospirillum sp. MSK14-1]|uniref:hypothetical protein n=1 Tax=Saccharospirillum sp. MSK14-1 TaxID=1897632 RepID=UPI000D3CD98B|nr:hypothetical protein [Saccharospirillum sp. MSK14-1]PTY35714.1 hypothetical protein BGP77_08695 [Saccharospirillum sp. MSK14-1]
MKFVYYVLPMLMLLAGCQALTLRSNSTVFDSATDQCTAPSQVPDLDNSQAALQGWLNIQLVVASGPLMQQWHALQHYDMTDPASAELMAALVTSRADMPESLRRLSQQTLARRLPYLPASIQPVFEQTQVFNEALLARDTSRRQRQMSERQRLQLEAELATKERQIEALTAIESQLHEEALSIPSAPDSGVVNDR